MLMRAPLRDGRHQLGAPGRIYVTEFVTVRRRGFLTSWWRPGRHRAPVAAPRHARRARRPAAAGGQVIARLSA